MSNSAAIREQKFGKVPKTALLSIIALLPFIQLGLSYYVSIATLVAILSVVAWNRRLIPHQFGWVIAAGLTVIGMFLCLLDPSSSRGAAEALRLSREALFFVAMTVGVRSFAENPPQINVQNLVKPLAIISVAFLILTLLQRTSLAHGRYLGLNPLWFSQNAGTLPDLLALRYTKPRPVGTFGEPSYFAFVVTSIIVILSPLVRTSRLAIIAIVALAITGLLTASLSFVLALPLLGYTLFWRNASARGKSTLLLLAAGLAVVFAVSTAERVSNRIAGPTRDRSTTARVIAPAMAMPEYLRDHPVGVTFATLPETVHSYVSPFGVNGTQAFDNAALDMFFFYGWIGLAVLVILFLSAQDTSVRIYLAVCLSFNGALFSTDKLSIVLLTVALMQAGRYYVANKTQMVPLGGFARAHAPPARKSGVTSPKEAASRSPGC